MCLTSARGPSGCIAVIPETLPSLMQPYPSLFGHPKEDVVAGVVVFLVALPLCLGIAIACGVPPVSGLIAGVVGGMVVPWISRSPLSVTGPAAGLTSIVLVEVTQLGGIPPFLTAVLLAGVLQAAFGILRLGRFSALVPSAVIKGMLAAIGITIVWKQLPVAFGVTGGLIDIPGAGASGRGRSSRRARWPSSTAGRTRRLRRTR